MIIIKISRKFEPKSLPNSKLNASKSIQSSSLSQSKNIQYSQVSQNKPIQINESNKTQELKQGESKKEEIKKGTKTYFNFYFKKENPQIEDIINETISNWDSFGNKIEDILNESQN